MKQLIFILLAIIGVSQAQTIQYIGAPTTTVISRGNFRTDSIFYLPKRTKLPTDTAALRYQISDSSLYAWTGSQWRKVGADADTLVYSTRAWRQKGDDSLSARINLKVNISDTASMLTPYLRKVDTTAMLSPYYRSATASAALATKLNISDTSTMLSPYSRTATVNASLATKLNISDTSSMLGNYIRHAGYGLTKSGQSFLVDTLNIATRAWRQKGIDSVANLSRVGGSGTINYVAKFSASTTLTNSSIVDNSSGVGIGTSPIANTKLYIRTNTSTDAPIYSDNGVNTGFIVKYGAEPITNIGNDFNRALGFLTNNTERMRIYGNGRVFIGASPSDGGFQLDINGTSRSGTLTINTNGQGRTISTFTGTNASGSNIFIGGGGLSSAGTVSIPDYGSFNTSIGVTSLRDLTEGYSNSALGMNTLRDVTTGYHNTGVGKDAGIRITTGYENVAVGSITLGTTTGYQNVAIGYFAGRLDTLSAFASSNNTSVFIGHTTKPALNGGSNEIVIGYSTIGNGSNTVTIGNSNITQNYFKGALNTSAPTGGSSKPWRLGEAATVTPTSPNRTIRVEIDGVVYYLHAKTTND